MCKQDTIVAIATPSSQGSISVIRISGEDAFLVASRVFFNERGKAIDLQKSDSHRIHYGYICDGDEKIDEVLVLVMRGPRSYTMENVVEIQCHGGSYICQVICDLLVQQGARIAEPGEFTKRAFLNGRIDLSQAEAVMDVIQSKSEVALDNSMHQLRGSVKDKIVDLRTVILEDLAHLEAALDDPEHISLKDYPRMLDEHITSLINNIDHLIKNSQNGRIIKEGIRTVIVGKPNVGKSSLLNCMLRENRAIVTDIPGTTRDMLEEEIKIGHVLLRLIDTAGIHDTDNKVENIGIQKTYTTLTEADFVICVLDGSETLTDEDKKILKKISDMPGLILYNKSDLPSKAEKKEIQRLSRKDIMTFSAKTGEGLDKLEEYLIQHFLHKNIDTGKDIYITNIRQKESLIRAKESLCKVKESIELGMPEDLYSIDMTDAYEYLGQVIGETLEEDVIDKIFKDFCMGK